MRYVSLAIGSRTREATAPQTNEKGSIIQNLIQYQQVSKIKDDQFINSKKVPFQFLEQHMFSSPILKHNICKFEQYINLVQSILTYIYFKIDQMQQSNDDGLHQQPLINQRDTTWEHVYNSFKLNEKYSESGKDSVLRKRMAKFFVNNEVSSPEVDRYYVQRRDNTMTQRSMLHFSNNSILLFGVDFLNERRIEQYFSPYMVAIDFHDDSHCSVIFESCDCLIAAIFKTLKNTAQITFQSFKQNCLSSQQYLVQWNQLLPYYELESQRKLWFRILTQWDESNRVQRRQSNMKRTYFMARNNLLSILSKNEDVSESINDQNDGQNCNGEVNIGDKYNRKLESNRSKLMRNSGKDRSFLNNSRGKGNQSFNPRQRNTSMNRNRNNSRFRQNSRHNSRQISIQSHNKSRSRSRQYHQHNHHHNHHHPNHHNHHHNSHHSSHHSLQNMLKCNCFKEQLIRHLNHQCSNNHRNHYNRANGHRNQNKSYNNRNNNSNVYRKPGARCQKRSDGRCELSRSDVRSEAISEQHQQSSINQQIQLFSDDQQHKQVQSLLQQFNKYNIFDRSIQSQQIQCQENINPNDALIKIQTALMSTTQQGSH